MGSESYCTVQLLNGFVTSLLYRIPRDLVTQLIPGSIVKVPLQRRTERALVVSVQQGLTVAVDYVVRDVEMVEQSGADGQYACFLKKLSDQYLVSVTAMYRKIHTPNPTQRTRVEGAPLESTLDPELVLTGEQRTVLAHVEPLLSEPVFAPFVLHGVTGSGKTAVYGSLLAKTIELRCSAIMMTPEAGLAVQLARTLRALNKELAPYVYEYHALATTAQRRALWRAVCSGDPVVVVGVHLPVLMPIPHLRCIIVDEEHDTGYQEKKSPRINSREAALLRAQQYRIPIVLGSATPSLHALHQVACRKWRLLTMHRRVRGAFPEIRQVKLRTSVRILPGEVDSFWISRDLVRAITDRLARSEQALIFLNRRGLNRMVQCGACAYQFTCSSCSVCLVLHEDQMMRCHYCAAVCQLPAQCPACAAPEGSLIKRGVGTQRIVTLLQQLFPQARIARADADTRSAQSWKTTLDGMVRGDIDIMVGTQTITKGFHFPKVTLVGILWAESLLSVPFYAAAEYTVQQLIQVAGRAGRASDHGLVVVQSFVESPLFSYISEAEYPAFYEYEIAHRRDLLYPPVARLSEIMVMHTDAAVVAREAQRVAETMRALSARSGMPVFVLGPAVPPIHRISGISMQKIHLKGGLLEMHRTLYRYAQPYAKTSRTSFTPNPLS